MEHAAAKFGVDQAQKAMDVLDGLEGVHGTCGVAKCYYPTPWGGYLFAQAGRFGAENNILHWKRAWALGRRLQMEYGATHLLSAPATEVAMSSEMAKRLNANNNSVQGMAADDSVRFSPNGTLLVQKVRKCPEPPCIFMGSEGPKRSIFMSDFENFLRAVDDKNNFLCNLASNLSATRAMLLREPCLVYDFQIFIGSNGGIFHLDLDRCTRKDLDRCTMGSREPMLWRKWPASIKDAFEQSLAFAMQLFNTTATCITLDDSTVVMDQLKQRGHGSMGFLTGLEDVHTCGVVKCYIPSPRSRGGYVFAQAYPSPSDVQESITRTSTTKGELSHNIHTNTLLHWKRSWEFGHRLHRDYGAEHLLSAPPTEVSISSKMASRLNVNAFRMAHGGGKAEHLKSTNLFSSNGTLLVLKVRDCPEPPCMFMGCYDCMGSRLDNFLRDFVDFLRVSNASSHFLCNLASNLFTTRAMLLKETCLIQDFQVFIGSKGGIFHLDLDRCTSLVSGIHKYWRKLPLPLDDAFGHILASTRKFLDTTDNKRNCSTPGVSSVT